MLEAIEKMIMYSGYTLSAIWKKHLAYISRVVIEEIFLDIDHCHDRAGFDTGLFAREGGENISDRQDLG